MRALEILHQQLTKSMGFMHFSRWKAVWTTVEALLSGGQLWLTALGRSRPGDAFPKHAIKAVDRLLGNQLLYAERKLVYASLAQLLLARCSSPVILVDTVEVRVGTYALSASVAFDGRAFPLYAVVVTKPTPATSVLQRFLRELADIMPAHCEPIVITDAGFGTPWFDAVQALGWQYIGRIRGQMKLRVDDDVWLSVGDLHKRATNRDKNLGQAFFPKRNPRSRRIVLSKKRTSLHRKRHTRSGTVGQRKDDRNHSKAANQPLLLTTSLRCRPTQVVALYALRMQIEQNYRDTKNHRWGWSLRHVGSRADTRIALLLLVASIAYFVQQSIGVAGEQMRLHHRHQANTVRKRRVLSFFVLGGLILRGNDQLLISESRLTNAIRLIRATIRSFSCA